MKNVLSYYYNLVPTSIHQVNKQYRCYIDNQEYIMTEYKDDLDKIDYLYQLNIYLLNLNFPCHEIILNNNNLILTYINNVPYILLKIYRKGNKITFDELMLFSDIPIDNLKLEKLVNNEWYNMWTAKIDYLEYQVSQIGKKYPEIMESFNFFIGLAENSISLLNEVRDYRDNLAICHRRIKCTSDVEEIYNPLNFIIDSKVRDTAEYIKSKYFYDNYTVTDAINDMIKVQLTNEQSILLYSRLLFPTYYFDICENIFISKSDKKDLNNILLKISSYIVFLKNLLVEMNKYYKIPEIEWIIKV